MGQVKGGLGRGLAALLPTGAGTLREIPLDEIGPNPRQPRREIDPLSLEELAGSIRAVGLLQPVIVRRRAEGDGTAGPAYELVVGERRWRASRRAGLERIPAIVREADDHALLRDALIENLQRVDLNALEEAAAYRQLVDDLGVTHEEVAARVGKSRAAITNALRLLALAPGVQMRIASGALTAAHGRAIAALADPEAQARAAGRAVAEGLSVKGTEELVRTLAAAGTPLSVRGAASRPPRAAGILEAEAALSDMLDTTVRIEAGRRRGRLIIEFAGPGDLNRIVRKITGEPAAPGSG
ncbi:MAG: ParB/RepB/Spo0J family partition protein [Acidobacteria bacterium]|nr:ParB/RepB/Spo0J family partition protein [Acidobacteriota bacterium]